MGRRSRKRSVTGAGGAAAPPREPAADVAPPRAAPASRRARLGEAPQPPWAPFPLTEICILIGLVVLGFAFLAGSSARVPLIVFGLGVVTLATLELSIREHLAGYRSHSALLAAIGAMLVAVPLAAFVRPDKGIVLIVAAVVFLLVFQLMRELFRRRSGGMSWRA